MNKIIDRIEVFFFFFSSATSYEYLKYFFPQKIENLNISRATTIFHQAILYYSRTYLRILFELRVRIAVRFTGKISGTSGPCSSSGVM